jgi:thiol-disulfide isomerase/thioredoxin
LKKAGLGRSSDSGGRPHRAAPTSIAGLILLILPLVLAPRAAGQDDAPGRDRLALPALDGEPLTTADLAAGVTVLVVWASWSPRCRDVGARIDRLAETWSSAARVASVVFQEDAAAIREAVARGGPAGPVYLDLTGDFSKRHAVTTLPMMLIFRDGELAFRGKLSANPDPVIERVLAGE